MEPLALTGNYRLVAAIFVGIAFGFLLIKSDLAWRSTCLNAIRLKDSRVLKTFLFSIAIGVTLFFFMEKSGLVRVHVRPAYFWASLMGGIICGTGISLCCRVPVTAIASLAAGRLYVIWVILGMLLAYPCVNFMSVFLSKTIYNWSEPIKTEASVGSFFNLTNASLWVAGISLLLVLFLHFTLGGDSDEK
jgi:hypothetical protein